MKLPLYSLLALFILTSTPSFADDDVDGRIYGRVVTDDGDIFEGLIRWDRNEASWVDILNGSKITRRSDRKGKRGTRIEVFGVKVYDEGDWNSSSSKISGIRFGHIQVLEPIDGNKALLTLQSGEQIVFSNGSTDIGNDVREIIVEDIDRGEVELRWRDIERIEFMQAPSSAYSEYGERLFGTLTTRGGYEFTGFICWDVDEVLTKDILDGDDKDRRRKIRFGTIERIGRNSSSSAYVVLNNGDEVVLRGTNDVNSSNSGILVLDDALGQIEIDWDDFEEVVFTSPTEVPRYIDFDYSSPLFGVVHTRDGEYFEGQIRWDDDEASTWELLNGNLRDIDFQIEFGKIQAIERISDKGASIILFDGRSFDLRDGNDVDEDNDGIFIMDNDGNEVRISWRDFERAEFDRP